MISIFAQALAAVQSAPVVASPAIPNSQDQLIQVSLALAAVLLLIYAIAWLIKRKQVVHGFSNIPMKTVGVLPMGVKEKIILVDVGGKQILLGMTAYNINTLATFDDPIVEDKNITTTSFSDKLKSILNQQKKSNSGDQPHLDKVNQDDD